MLDLSKPEETQCEVLRVIYKCKKWEAPSGREEEKHCDFAEPGGPPGMCRFVFSENMTWCCRSKAAQNAIKEKTDG